MNATPQKHLRQLPIVEWANLPFHGVEIHSLLVLATGIRTEC